MIVIALHKVLPAYCYECP